MSAVTAEMKAQYEREGYFILERATPPEFLASLRGECDRFIHEMDARMDADGVSVLGLNHKGSRYFLGLPSQSSAPIHDFLFSDFMEDIVRAVVGEDAYLFFDQYVVKAAEKGMKFSWHQDGGYIGYEHQPYLTCWCPLDDVNEANGTVYVLPYSLAGTRDYVPHVLDSETNDKVGYFGDEPGIPVIVPAGSIVCFRSTVLHRSGYNHTDKMRRVFLMQYSPEPIYNREGTAPRHLAEPFLEQGRRINGGAQSAS